MAQAGKGVKRREPTDEEITAEVDRRYKAIMRGYWQVREESSTEVETKEDPHFLVLNTGGGYRMTLKPCPFCGGEGMVMATDDTYRHVECKECDARGPNSPTIDDAVFCWNQRWNGRWCEA